MTTATRQAPARPAQREPRRRALGIDRRPGFLTYGILLGAVFMIIVYLLPNGVVGLARRLRKADRTASPAAKEAS